MSDNKPVTMTFTWPGNSRCPGNPSRWHQVQMPKLDRQLKGFRLINDCYTQEHIAQKVKEEAIEGYILC